MFSVYLVGPVTGCVQEFCVDWRESFHGLVAYGIRCISPLAGEPLPGVGKLMGTIEGHPLMNPRSVMSRDHFNTGRCDIVVVNFLNATHVSIGSVIEMAWAYEMRKPVILIMEKHGNVHDHFMVNEIADYHVETELEAVAIVNLLYKGK